jgi:hypothetical protein
MMITDPLIWTMMVNTGQNTGGYIPKSACAATAALKSAISTIAATMNSKVSMLRAMGHVHRHSRITSTQSGSGGSDFHCVTALVSRCYADSGAASAQIAVVTGSLSGADTPDRIPDWPANHERTGDGVVDALEIGMFKRPETSPPGDEGLLIF